MKRILEGNDEIRLMCELWPVGLEATGTDPRSHLQLLLNMGFIITDIRTGETISRYDEIDNLLAKYTAYSTVTNLFCKRSD